MSRGIKDYVTIALKGMGMGAADVVPGVSGGTIAFIAGIYQELLDSINAINIPNLKLLLSGKIGAFWKAVNGSFLLALLSGIAVSILSLAKAITWMLDHQPVIIWSFFFGLVLASIFYVLKQIKKFQPIPTGIPFLIGAATAYFITSLGALEQTQSLPYLFMCGAIAICAMILPGISGSFILVLLGAYSTVLGAIHDLNFAIIGIFALGCIIGLLGFSRVLSWLLKHYHDITIALLAGFMLGSLNKVWPWKETISTYLNSKGEPVPFQQANILPPDNSWMIGLLAFAVGFVLIFAIEFVASRAKKQS